MSLQSEFIAPVQRAASLTPEELADIMARARAERARTTRQAFGAIGSVLGRIFARRTRRKAPLAGHPA